MHIDTIINPLQEQPDCPPDLASLAQARHANAVHFDGRVLDCISTSTISGTKE